MLILGGRFWGVGSLLGLGFVKILCNFKATKPVCSLLHISQFCKRNGKLYHAFHSHFVQAAVTWTQCGGQQRPGQNTCSLNLLIVTSSLDLFPRHAAITHTQFHLTLWHMHVKITLNFISTATLLIQLKLHTAYTATFPPCSRIYCNFCRYKWMQFKTLPWFSLQTQKFWCKQRWWEEPEELPPFPLSLSH